MSQGFLAFICNANVHDAIIHVIYWGGVPDMTWDILADKIRGKRLVSWLRCLYTCGEKRDGCRTGQDTGHPAHISVVVWKKYEGCNSAMGWG